MTLPSRPRWLSRLQLAVFLCLLPVFLFHALPQTWHTLNTDFPNYYLASRLVHDHQDTSRMYEWKWFQREKNIRAINREIIGLVPITPVSTLVVYPLAGMQPLHAKRVWIVLNLLLLAWIAAMLRPVAGLSWLESGLLFLLSYPLYKNLLFGQFYILLLFVLVAGCWAFVRKQPALAGAMVAVAIALKIFPAILLYFFFRKQSWMALASTIATSVVAFSISIAAFGWSLNRTYLAGILPPSMHGDALPPYMLISQSFSVVSHRLFVFEPQFNPHPLANAPWLFALLHPLFQLAVLLPVILRVSRGAGDKATSALEWSILLTASLAISPLPASYHFCVLVLPMAVAAGILLEARRYSTLLVFLAAYLVIGYPSWNTGNADGLRMLLHVPRLWSTLLFLAGLISLLPRKAEAEATSHHSAWNQRPVWAVALIAATGLSVLGGLRSARHLQEDYPYRVAGPPQSILLSLPHAMPDGSIRYIAMGAHGYQLAETRNGTARYLPGNGDALSLATDSATGTQALESDTPQPHLLVTTAASTTFTISNAVSPALLPHGAGIAFLRNEDGRYRLFVSTATGEVSRALSPPGWNVLEAAVAPDGRIFFAAEAGAQAPAIFSIPVTGGTPHLLLAGNSRYPTVSPDGSWLAYSRFEHGFWALRLHGLRTGEDRSLDTVPCNRMEPSWDTDSRTLLYASDCGRALWFTAISRRKVLP